MKKRPELLASFVLVNIVARRGVVRRSRCGACACRRCSLLLPLLDQSFLPV